jgi:hypothetical protein
MASKMAPAVPRCLHADFCNKIGTKRTSRYVRSSVAIRGKADVARAAHFDIE